MIACVGDGSYMFGNPVPSISLPRAENLPTLTVVANNHSWLAVRQSTLAVYPDGAASKANVMPIQDLNPSPAFRKGDRIRAAAIGEKVEAPERTGGGAQAQLREALRSGTPALLNVSVQAIR